MRRTTWHAICSGCAGDYPEYDGCRCRLGGSRATAFELFTKQLAETIEPTMQNLYDALTGATGPELKTTTTRVKRLAPRERPAKKATLVMACPLGESNQRWIRELKVAFALCEVTDLRALEQAMASLKPDVLVVDLAFPGLRRVRGLRDIQRLNPATKMVALADAPADEEGIFALKAGATGYCACAIDPAELMKAVTAVQKGEIWASRKLVRGLIAELVSLVDNLKQEGRQPKRDPRIESLTKRQRVVADLISRGASNKEIGNRLNISERTVKAHLTEAFRSVGVSDRLHLALLFQGHSRAPGDD